MSPNKAQKEFPARTGMRRLPCRGLDKGLYQGVVSFEYGELENAQLCLISIGVSTVLSTSA